MKFRYIINTILKMHYSYDENTCSLLTVQLVRSFISRNKKQFAHDTNVMLGKFPHRSWNMLLSHSLLCDYCLI